MTSAEVIVQPHVIVIGAGSTGAATAHDLALRGIRVTVVDRGGVASGTSGRNHCLLHSGGRYCVNDRESAAECITENTTLRRVMPGLMELNGGLFVALTEEDMLFKERFLEGCAACHIPAQEVSREQALRMEPLLNPRLLAAVQVPDGVFEPYRFCLALLATAEEHGAVVRPYTPVTGLLFDGRTAAGVQVRDLRTLRSESIGADLVVNAAGPWAGQVALMAGLEKMLRTGEQLVPAIREARIRGTAAAARPLVSKGGADLRQVSRTFECFDHGRDGVPGLVTIAGGKMTTARAMAEAASDLVCCLLGVEAPCRTRETPLASHRSFRESGGVAS
jgi:glycerol-3-phosphate dehydrogenase